MLLLSAEHDRFVHNRAMNIFSKSAPHSQIFFAPDACHELLFEKPAIRGAAYRAITDFFTQTSDDVALVQVTLSFREGLLLYTSGVLSHMGQCIRQL